MPWQGLWSYLSGWAARLQNLSLVCLLRCRHHIKNYYSNSCLHFWNFDLRRLDQQTSGRQPCASTASRQNWPATLDCYLPSAYYNGQLFIIWIAIDSLTIASKATAPDSTNDCWRCPDSLPQPGSDDDWSHSVAATSASADDLPTGLRRRVRSRLTVQRRCPLLPAVLVDSSFAFSSGAMSYSTAWGSVSVPCESACPHQTASDSTHSHCSVYLACGRGTATSS